MWENAEKLFLSFTGHKPPNQQHGTTLRKVKYISATGGPAGKDRKRIPAAIKIAINFLT